MRTILISLLVMAAPAVASDHAIAILHPRDARIESYPDNGEVYVGARFIGTAHVKQWLAGSMDVSEIIFDLNVPDAQPLGDFYAIVEKDQYGHLDIWDISAVKGGFCLDAKNAAELAEPIAQLKRRFPCARK
jgi:hypothetical protein